MRACNDLTLEHASLLLNWDVAIAGGLASEVMMIYCCASFCNWQMETTRCWAREGGKFLFIRAPLTFTAKEKRPHPVLPSAEVMCWLPATLQRLRRHAERQPSPSRSGSLRSMTCPLVSWSDPSCTEAVLPVHTSYTVSVWEQNAGNSCSPFDRSSLPFYRVKTLAPGKPPNSLGIHAGLLMALRGWSFNGKAGSCARWKQCTLWDAAAERMHFPFYQPCS